jgi:hypothetical protein
VEDWQSSGIFAQPNAFLLAIQGAGLIYTSIRSPNFHKKYKNDGSWKFEIDDNSK